MEEMANKIKACGGDQNCEQPIREHYADLDEQRNKAFPELCRANLTSCVQIANRLSAEEQLNVDLMESLRNAQYNGIAGAIGIAFIPSNRVSADQATLEYVRQTGGTAEEFKAVLAMLGAGVAGVGPKTVEKATNALDRLKALQAAKGTVPAEVPATSVIAKEGLYNELRAAQARDALIGTTLPGAKAPVTVTAEGSVGGKVLVDTNQTARPAMVSDASKKTLISDLIPPGSPNSTMANAHAEMAVIQRAYDAGLTRGQSMSIIVRGEEICSFCQSSTNILAAAERSGLNSLKLVEAKTGRTFTWTRGIDGWR
ncbi:cytidine deaminase-like fold-containing protein [Pseudomonas aeruginosa]